MKCLLLFYTSFAKSVISYGILTYGSSARPNLGKAEKAQRAIRRVIFFKINFDSVRSLVEKNKLLTAFKLYVMELFGEVL